MSRATHDLWAGDPAFASLIERLRGGSAEFALWWQDRGVGAASARRKTPHYPTLGVVAFEHVTFQADDDPGLKLAIYTPV